MGTDKNISDSNVDPSNLHSADKVWEVRYEIDNVKGLISVYSREAALDHVRALISKGCDFFSITPSEGVVP